MTKKEIYSRVFEIITQRRNNAVINAEKNKQTAMKDDLFASLCQSERLLNMDIGKCRFENKDASKLENNLNAILSQKNAQLKNLGFDIDDLSPKYVCKKCSDTGIFQNKICSCATQLANDILMKNCGVELSNMPYLKNYDCNFFDDKDEIDFAKKCVKTLIEYANNLNSLQIKNIVMCGASGTGKTYLSKCLAKELIENNYTTIFISAFELNNMFLEEHLSQSEDADKLRDLIDADCLIIDDLGTEPIRKNVTKEYLLLLINERLSKNKASIITTNLSPEQVLERYDERIFSRIFNKRCTLVLKFEGKNVRTKNKK